MKKVAILQSNYIPWKGYFDIIRSVDEFIFYDEVQYTKRDWRNRNRIKTPNGLLWLTVPVGNYKLGRKISEITVMDQSWREKHWKTIRLNYSRSPCFSEFSVFFEQLFLEGGEEFLAGVNHKFISEICKLLEIQTKFSHSRDFELSCEKNEKLINICREAGADVYLSGPAAKNYLDEKVFKAAGIRVEWMDYSAYREYPQLFGKFEHSVSILDLIFNTGKDAVKYMRNLSC